jgi:amino acid transporter
VPAPHAADALLGMLFPLWQLVIGGCALAVLALSINRLRARGSSRMVRALTLTGLAILFLAVFGMFLDSCSPQTGASGSRHGRRVPTNASLATR